MITMKNIISPVGLLFVTSCLLFSTVSTMEEREDGSTDPKTYPLLSTILNHDCSEIAMKKGLNIPTIVQTQQDLTPEQLTPQKKDDTKATEVLDTSEKLSKERISATQNKRADKEEGIFEKLMQIKAVNTNERKLVEEIISVHEHLAKHYGEHHKLFQQFLSFEKEAQKVLASKNRAAADIDVLMLALLPLDRCDALIDHILKCFGPNIKHQRLFEYLGMLLDEIDVAMRIKDEDYFFSSAIQRFIYLHHEGFKRVKEMAKETIEGKPSDIESLILPEEKEWIKLKLTQMYCTSITTFPVGGFEACVFGGYKPSPDAAIRYFAYFPLILLKLMPDGLHNRSAALLLEEILGMYGCGREPEWDDVLSDMLEESASAGNPIMVKTILAAAVKRKININIIPAEKEAQNKAKQILKQAQRLVVKKLATSTRPYSIYHTGAKDRLAKAEVPGDRNYPRVAEILKAYKILIGRDNQESRAQLDLLLNPSV